MQFCTECNSTKKEKGGQLKYTSVNRLMDETLLLAKENEKKMGEKESTWKLNQPNFMVKFSFGNLFGSWFDSNNKNNHSLSAVLNTGSNKRKKKQQHNNSLQSDKFNFNWMWMPELMLTVLSFESWRQSTNFGLSIHFSFLSSIFFFRWLLVYVMSALAKIRNFAFQSR